ncbi:DUF4136 domain-containing protein [Runella sp.]|uniref:DUF4136 domain-containing protein n=1 Tax=Runella sp. TaxID=1960881 RepID=UPI003D0E3465
MKTIAFVTALAIAFASCTTVKVNRSSANLAKYKSYAFMEPDVKAGRNPLYYNDIATQNVEAVVDNTLLEKGLQKNEDNPDLLVGYHFFVQQKTRTVTDPAPFYGPYMGWGRWGWRGWSPGYWGWGRTRTETYQDGTLVVDMVDARSKKLVWRGSIENAITSPANITERLPKEVNKILEKYPG